MLIFQLLFLFLLPFAECAGRHGSSSSSSHGGSSNGGSNHNSGNMASGSGPAGSKVVEKSAPPPTPPPPKQKHADKDLPVFQKVDPSFLKGNNSVMLGPGPKKDPPTKKATNNVSFMSPPRPLEPLQYRRSDSSYSNSSIPSVIYSPASKPPRYGVDPPINPPRNNITVGNPTPYRQQTNSRADDPLPKRKTQYRQQTNSRADDPLPKQKTQYRQQTNSRANDSVTIGGKKSKKNDSKLEKKESRIFGETSNSRLEESKLKTNFGKLKRKMFRSP